MNSYYFTLDFLTYELYNNDEIDEDEKKPIQLTKQLIQLGEKIISNKILKIIDFIQSNHNNNDNRYNDINRCKFLQDIVDGYNNNEIAIHCDKITFLFQTQYTNEIQPELEGFLYSPEEYNIDEKEYFVFYSIEDKSEY
jgi:hypothetical protein